jgi:TrmH family RNA methyltransferase
VERIASRQNAIVKAARAAAAGREGHLLLDGAHLVRDALAAGVVIDLVAVAEDDVGEVQDLAQCAAKRGARVAAVSAPVMAAMSPVRAPSGIVALARRPATPEDVFSHTDAFVLMLVDVQDPGNVGAIVRAADACGATAVVASRGTADPFGWKALRGSMGSAFRVPVVPRADIGRAATDAAAAGLRLHAAVPRDGVLLDRCDLRARCAVLLGAEGSGLPEAIVAHAHVPLTIPMRDGVESLNVATAAAIIAYEARRQRSGSAGDR